jgi:hypothetical protein
LPSHVGLPGRRDTWSAPNNAVIVTCVVKVHPIPPRILLRAPLDVPGMVLLLALWRLPLYS